MTRGGKHTIKDTGPLTKKRMETIDDEIVDGAIDFIQRKHNSRTPFFLWINTTHMHFRTHTKRRSLGQAGRWQSPYHDTMIDHDKHVGRVLAKLDQLGIAEDTIVVYSTDNGVHMNSWPDAGMTPFRSEKNTNWEGAFRVPFVIRWPGRIPANVVSNEIVSHLDWLPTFLAAAGESDIKEKLLAGHEAAEKTFKVHLDGFNLLPYLTGETEESPRTRSSTSQTTAIWSRSATTTGSSSSCNSGCPERSRSGASRSWRPGSPTSTTSEPTRTSAPRSRPTPTGIGTSTAPSSSSPRRRSWASS
jgi:arylsulfatase